MSVYVFLGPSLPVKRARTLLDATYLPPVQQGDIIRVLAANPRAIAIIDGYFELVPAVWHKEILLALSKGVHVFGSSSMGALRAAELGEFGMVGIGKIHDMFRSGALTDDDDVAVTHGPPELDYVRFSEAMVDIRDACEAARNDGVITSDLCSRLVSLAKKLEFGDRTFEQVARLAVAEGKPAPTVQSWLEFTRARGPGLKERDAAALLAHLSHFLASSPASFAPRFTLERSEFLQRLVNEVELSRVTGADGQPVDARQPMRQSETLTMLRKKMLLRLLARQEAQRLEWTLSEVEVNEQLRALCTQRGLKGTDELQLWMKKEGLSEAALWRFVNDACFVDRLERMLGDEISAGLADQLRLATLRDAGSAKTLSGSPRASGWP